MLVKRFLFFIQKQMSFEVNASGEGVPSPESPSGLGQFFFQLLRANWGTPLQGLPLPEAGCLAQLFTEWFVQEYKGSPPVSISLKVIPAPGLPIGLVKAFNAAASLFGFSFCPGLLPSSQIGLVPESTLHWIPLAHQSQCVFQGTWSKIFQRREKRNTLTGLTGIDLESGMHIAIGRKIEC